MSKLDTKAQDAKYALNRVKRTLPQVVNLLDKVIKEYRASNEVSYSGLLVKHNMYMNLLNWWKKTYPASVGERVSILDEIRRARIEEALTKITDKDGAKPQSSPIIFYAKTCGMIEEERARALEKDAPTFKLEGEIKIGFGEEYEEEK